MVQSERNAWMGDLETIETHFQAPMAKLMTSANNDA